MTAKTDPLESIRERKQALLKQVEDAAGDPDKQDALQAQLRELRKEKADVGAAQADTSES